MSFLFRPFSPPVCLAAALLSSNAGGLELLPSQRGRRPRGICMSAHPVLHLPCCTFDWALDSFWFCFQGIWDEILC